MKALELEAYYFFSLFGKVVVRLSLHFHFCLDQCLRIYGRYKYSVLKATFHIKIEEPFFSGQAKHILIIAATI